MFQYIILKLIHVFHVKCFLLLLPTKPNICNRTHTHTHTHTYNYVYIIDNYCFSVCNVIYVTRIPFAIYILFLMIIK